MDLAKKINKVAALAGVCPGFIGNRMLSKRGLPAQQLLKAGAMPWDIDAAFNKFGFKMGPFELMDLIGIDVNFMVTESVYDQYFQEARFRPHLIQRKMVESGLLGKKTGKGFY